ncbi:DUF3047 domain-containing protein [Aidingimonas halophila]|uniref:DUF3047 domain-containing protein n=1 Tax=Aidingimonas halophila TaxID=574349 RepID=A0A1H2SA12_9GAMM|nr:DUF3047 domain-containing protein [Aidingimonas halophila]GHC17971.1 hypothetical protein GCM10008094_04620 [Aidingimonas halophila]SDW28462.1 Protein of unknown function [Aidingimonas halophila]
MLATTVRLSTIAPVLLWSLITQADSIAFTNQAIIDDWSTKSFEGETEYELVEWNGEQVVRARSEQQASAKYLERGIDLEATPYLHWCWRIDTQYEGLDETTKQGDDYPARVYVARKTGLLPWQVESVNYVWSSNQPQGTQWPNAFTSRAQLIAARGKDDPSDQWMAEVRDVREDYQRLFDSRPDHVDGVALMSDGDNAHVDGTAWFTNLGFSDSPEPPDCPA